jgi:hypothetical protein
MTRSGTRCFHLMGATLPPLYPELYCSTPDRLLECKRFYVPSNPK